MKNASSRTNSKKWWAKGMAATIGRETLVSAATIMTTHKPTEEELKLIEEAEKKGEAAPTKRKTTTQAFQRQPLILVRPSDEQALAYVRKHPVAIKQSTNLMARYASYGPKTKEAVDALVKPPIPPQASDATLPLTTLAHTGEHVRLDDAAPA